MRNNLVLYSWLTAIFIGSFLISYSICQSLTLNINNVVYNISYNSSSCNLLNSPTVSNNIKCLMLCQMTICKSLIFDVTTNRCILNGSQPGLIKYDNLTNLNIVYNLGRLSLLQRFSIILGIKYNFFLLYIISHVFEFRTILSIWLHLQWICMLEWNLCLHEEFNSVNNFIKILVYLGLI